MRPQRGSSGGGAARLARPRAGSARPSVLFVTNHVPPDRAGAFAALHEREGIELALFGGRSHHATAGLDDPGVPHRRVGERDVHALAASGRYRAVVCGTAGRLALPAAWLGARRAGVPFVLWSALWAELGTPVHVAARPLMAMIYRTAAAVVAYGPHVAAYARRHGARRVHLAPQAVDNDWWATGARPAAADGPLRALFVGRDAPEKGLAVLREAWSVAGLYVSDAALTLAGAEEAGAVTEPWRRDAVAELGHVGPDQLRNLYGSAGVLVVPSVGSRSFREPWGLVVNEAMNQHVAIVASDAVGAAAGGLVREGRNGLVVRGGDPYALAVALRRLHADAPLVARLAAQAAHDVRAYTFEAWAAGFAEALDPVRAAR